MTCCTTSIFRFSRDNLLFTKKNKVHSHRDIYSINIILQCPLLLINSWIEEGCQIKYMRQAQKVLWVVLSSLFFKEIWKKWQDIWLQVVKEINKSRFNSYGVRNSVLLISHITFWDCHMHIFSNNLSRNSCMYINSVNIIPYSTSPKKNARMFVIGKNVLPCLGWRLT